MQLMHGLHRQAQQSGVTRPAVGEAGPSPSSSAALPAAQQKGEAARWWEGTASGMELDN